MATQYVAYPGVLSGGGGGGSAVYTDEAPVGVINGVNVTFNLSSTPTDVATLNLFLDGIRLNRGVGLDYTLAANVITMAVAPALAQTLWANYRST